MSRTPRIPNALGISPNVTLAISKVKAGLKVRTGVTSDASPSLSASVDATVAARLRSAEPRTPSQKIRSTTGTGYRATATNPRIGSDSAFTPHATTATGVSASSRLLMIGRNDVRKAETRANPAQVLTLT